MPIGDPFLLGVNYWPRAKAMYWWENFDAGEVRDEFAMIKELGLGYVRFFLLWESFQPKPDTISQEKLKSLRIVCDIAGELGLKLQPTFFTGHMSGPNWAPDWLVSPLPRIEGERQLVSLNRKSGSPNRVYNVYTEPFVIEAEKLQLRTVVTMLKDHPAVWAYSLGNEPDLFCRPPTAEAGKRWVGEMVRTIKAIDPSRPVLIGLHTASMNTDCGLRIDHIAQETDISVMHGYSIYDPLARHLLDPDFVPFAGALTAALAGRPVLFEEMGLCTQEVDAPSKEITMPRWNGAGTRTQLFASDEDGAEYYRQVLRRLQKTGALGAFAWCFPDYARELWDRPPCDFQWHERFFGLVRANGSVKPMGKVVQEFARTQPKVCAPEKTVKLAISADEYYRNPQAHLPALYRAFGTVD
ncbi:MAG TPA: glycoside hydrolase family 2 TIM barrel-domain containing protein [Planctomycetota bacterium]|nr:glycoside hydrolase family 2 TIM barrel-domain containing protein [Planctomycetota bacterium]